MLLIHSPTDRHSAYSRYLAELLRLEGFADFGEAELGAVDAAILSGQDLVVLPRLTTTVAQAEMLGDYVAAGGRLLAFLPDFLLLQKTGLRPTFRGVDAGYLHLDASQPVLAGLCAEPVQVVVPAVGWAPAGDAETGRPAYGAARIEPEPGWAMTEGAQVTVLAELRDGRDAARSNPIPAVVRAGVGKGEAVLFAYDLPHAVARLRQGNPAHADLCLAGLDGIYRAGELFVGQLDPQQTALPQADVQTALLARLIETLAPRPRIWYYPQADQRSVLVMTSDDDWATVEQFEALVEGLRRREGTCSFFIVPGTNVPEELMARWEQAGHAFSVHPAHEADHRPPTAPKELQPVFMPGMLRDNVERHRREHGRPVRTVRNHCVRWLGYVEAARVLAELGVGMDCNYFGSCQPFSLGHMCGSGRPLRFVDTDGTIVGCFQQPTSWSEECLLSELGFSLDLGVDRALAETTAIIRRAAREFYTPVTVNSHPAGFATYSRPLIEGNWDTARAEGMPILSADEWLRWTDARDGMRLTREGGSWTLHSPQASPVATLLFPPGSSPRAERAVAGEQVLWERPYQSLTLQNLQAGERRRIALVGGA